MRHGRMHIAIHSAGDQGRHDVSFTFPRRAFSGSAWHSAFWPPFKQACPLAATRPTALSYARKAGLGCEGIRGQGMKELVGIAEQVAAKLSARKQTIAVAESSTGGLISASLLAVPGASAYFLGGAVVYTRD